MIKIGNNQYNLQKQLIDVCGRVSPRAENKLFSISCFLSSKGAAVNFAPCLWPSRILTPGINQESHTKIAMNAPRKRPAPVMDSDTISDMSASFSLGLAKDPF